MAEIYDQRFGLDSFELYNFAREFRKKIYTLIREIHSDEKYCLMPQMRRAAISITNNIAEGHGRWHYQENIRFCRIARGSVEEIIDDLNICLDEHYADQIRLCELKDEAKIVIARINSYIAYLRRTQQKG